MSFNFYKFQESKSQKTYMKRERFATQDKTKQCSHCKLASVKIIRMGKEIRRLCPKHLQQYQNKDDKIPVTFTKASNL